MIRTQVSLEPEQMERLRELAHARGVSIAALVREGVAAYLESAAESEHLARARAASGSLRWPGNGREHDDELAHAFGR